jgi:uncharacterized cupin superfamily protein
MPDVNVLHYTEFTPKDEKFFLARRDLGVRSFGLQVGRLRRDEAVYPAHDESESGQEEVYVVLSGSGTLVADGEEFPMRAGSFARVGPSAHRDLHPADGEELVILVLGGTPGQAYQAPDWTNEP